jgi:hypothetical protein
LFAPQENPDVVMLAAQGVNKKLPVLSPVSITPKQLFGNGVENVIEDGVLLAEAVPYLNNKPEPPPPACQVGRAPAPLLVKTCPEVPTPDTC